MACSRLAAALCLGAGLLAGCGQDAQPPGGAKLAGAPCDEPAPMNFPSPAEPLNEVQPGLSPKARRNHQNGCAGVRFHIAEDGTVKDASLIVENPQGYGFGEAALAALAETRYDPKKSNRGWYYLNTVFVQAASSGPPRPPSAF